MSYLAAWFPYYTRRQGRSCPGQQNRQRNTARFNALVAMHDASARRKQ